MIKWEKHQEHVLEVNGKAGDAVIFTETLTHGTLPWTAAHERRALLYKFSQVPCPTARARTRQRIPIHR